MLTTINPKPADDPHDVLVVAPDVVLMAPTDEELSRLARSLRHPVSPQVRTGADLPSSPMVPPVDTTFRPAAVGDAQVSGRRRTMGQQAARAVTAALLVAACTGAAAIAWQSYGGSAEQIMARWAPQRVLASLLPLESSTAAQADLPAAEATAPNPASAQPGFPAQTAQTGVAPAAVAAAVESSPSLGSMTNEIASVRLEIEKLNASLEELKARQQQMSRDIAKASEARPSETRTSEVKASEQSLRPKTPARPRPTTARLRTPTSPQQAAAYPTSLQPAAPYVPRQIETPPQTTAEPLTDPELASVPRPPMPLR